MNNLNIFKILSKYKKSLENKGYNVIYIGLYGSQNYSLDDELSDIDAKAIVLPKLYNIIFRQKISEIVECDEGNIDVKDLITFYDVIKKGNFSYVESIDTEYSIGDKKIKELFKQFRPNLKSILGAMLEKRKALTHEYPSKKEEFKKWGFDPKQYHHIIRLYEILKENKGNSYICYSNDNSLRNYLIDIKRNKNNLTSNEAEKDSDLYINKAKELIPKDYVYKAINIDNEINSYIENKIKLELLKDSKISSARETRTFDSKISTKDLEKFPILKEYDGKDISYIVYETIEIL